MRVVESDQRVTRLGEGLAASGRLGVAPAERTARVVVEYVARARAAGAERVGIVATSAVREAANQAEFVAMLERATGERVRVITGEEEATLTLAGVLHGLRGPLDGSTLLFDIGGGQHRVPGGAGRHGGRRGQPSSRRRRSRRALPVPGRVDWPRYRALQDEVAGRLARELPPAILAARPARIVGTAGTVTALAALDLGLTTYDRARVQGHALQRTAVERLLQRLGALTAAERGALAVPGARARRPDRAGRRRRPGDARTFTAGSLVVSDAALREGIVLQLSSGRA